MSAAARGTLAETEALDLLAFLVTSAEGCLKEPPLYGVSRLTAAAVKLAGAWLPDADADTAAMLRDLLARWDPESVLQGSSSVQLKQYLQQAALAVAREIERRDLGSPAP
jgi:hypothetical protein